MALKCYFIQEIIKLEMLGANMKVAHRATCTEKLVAQPRFRLTRATGQPLVLNTVHNQLYHIKSNLIIKTTIVVHVT